MGVSIAPKIVASGLTLHYDLQNEKSYRGMPITNQFAVPTPDGSNNVTFSVQGTGTFRRIFSGVFNNYTIKSTDVVYQYDLGGTGCHYHGNDVTMSAGQYATWQFEYLISSQAGAIETNYLANMENIGSGIGMGIALTNTTTQIGTWQNVRVTTGPTSTGGGIRPLLYPGACSGSRLTPGGFILYKNPAVWFTSFVPTYNIPFVAGTRSTNNSIIDMTGINTITATSLTYAANGSVSFNGSSDFITIPNTTLGNGNLPWTVSAWIKTTTNASTLGTGSILSNQSGGPVYSMMGVNSGKIVYWTYQNGAWAQKLGVGTTVNDGNWHMLTWVNYSNSTMDMYVDGILDSNVANSTSGNQNPVDVIGRSWAAYFNGSIDTLSIYNGRALTSSEVRQNFNALRGRYGV